MSVTLKREGNEHGDHNNDDDDNDDKIMYHDKKKGTYFLGSALSTDNFLVFPNWSTVGGVRLLPAKVWAVSFVIESCADNHRIYVKILSSLKQYIKVNLPSNLVIPTFAIGVLLIVGKATKCY